MDKHNIKSKKITGKHWRKQHINTESKQTNKQKTNEDEEW
jgi:hypothetical protein